MFEAESGEATGGESLTSTEGEPNETDQEGGESGDSGHKGNQEPGHAKASKAKGAKAQGGKADASADDEEEEIKIGALSAKLPKKIAHAIKQLERGFHLKSQESAKLKKEFEELDFKELAKRRGVDPYELAENWLVEKIEEMSLTDEQKRLRELEAENKTFKEQKEAEEKAAKERELSAAEEKLSKQMRTEMLEAWKSSGLPAHPYFGQVMAATIMRGKNSGQDLQWGDAAAIVKEEFLNHVQQVVATMEPDAIQSLLGKEVMKKIREHDVKRVTEKASLIPGRDTRPGASKPASGKANQRKPLNESDWWEQMRRLAE